MTKLTKAKDKNAICATATLAAFLILSAVPATSSAANGAYQFCFEDIIETGRTDTDVNESLLRNHGYNRLSNKRLFTGTELYGESNPQPSP